MEILRTIAFYTESKKLNFVIIGGHAVNSYGISRHTADIDLVVPLEDKSLWQELMNKLNYSEGQSDNRFSRFRPKNLDNWPIDIMYVDNTTFEKIYNTSKQATFGEAEVKVASAEHLILMKLHALKFFQEHRYAKDYSDLISLIRSIRLEPASNDFKKQCEKYASIELYQQIIRDFKKNEKQ